MKLSHSWGYIFNSLSLIQYLIIPPKYKLWESINNKTASKKKEISPIYLQIIRIYKDRVYYRSYFL